MQNRIIEGFDNFTKTIFESENDYIAEDGKYKDIVRQGPIRLDKSKTYIDSHSIYLTETLIALDTLVSIILSVEEDPGKKQAAIDDYKRKIEDISNSVSDTPESIKSAWDKISDEAINLNNQINSSEKGNPKIEDKPIEEFKRQMADLEKKKNSMAFSAYQSKKKELMDELRDKTSTVELLNYTTFKEAAEHLKNAVDVLKKGALEEIKAINLIPDKDSIDKAFNKVMDSFIVLFNPKGRDPKSETSDEAINARIEKEKKSAIEDQEKSTTGVYAEHIFGKDKKDNSGLPSKIKKKNER